MLGPVRLLTRRGLLLAVPHDGIGLVGPDTALVGFAFVHSCSGGSGRVDEFDP